MKILLLLLVIATTISAYFLLHHNEAPSNTTVPIPRFDIIQRKNQGLTTLTKNNTEKVAIKKTEVLIESATLEKIEFILTDAHSSSEKYKLLLALLESDELTTLEMLGNFYFPEDLSIDDPRYEQILMVNRAMLEFYGQKPLAETIDKLDVMRSSELLYGYVVSDLFFAAEGSENTETSYNWIIQNPDEYASKSSGRTIGGKLADFDHETALDKALMLPAGTIRSQAFSTLVSNLSQDDLDVAMDFVMNTEQSEDYDQVTSDMVTAYLSQRESFSEIVDLATSPIQSNYRMATMTTLFNKWAQKSPASLKQWLNDTEHENKEVDAEIRVISKQALNRYEIN